MSPSVPNPKGKIMKCTCTQTQLYWVGCDCAVEHEQRIDTKVEQVLHGRRPSDAEIELDELFHEAKNDKR